MKAIALCSGGLDSTVLLYHLLHEGQEVRGLSVDYGQRHRQPELAAAAAICSKAGIESRVADLRSLQPILAGSALTDDIAVPHGHYADETMKVTVVPNRNMILLSVAIGWAVSLKYNAVAYAAHSGDHTIYPDCRPEFVDAMDVAAGLCDYQPITIERPFVNKTKADVVRYGAELNVPFELTWSCYEGGTIHCGECGTCVERKEAFRLAEVSDSTKYMA